MPPAAALARRSPVPPLLRALAAAMLLAVVLAAALAPRGAAARGCTFQPPANWNAETTRWDGPCAGGAAEGLGVLKEYERQEGQKAGPKVMRFFFGRMKGGQLDEGVIDQESGYIAGRFAGGRLLSSGERQVTVAAFAEAEKAARAAAERFSQAGNKASASFYLDKARQLRDQLD